MPSDSSSPSDHTGENGNRQESPEGTRQQNGQTGNEAVPRPKRIACILCRKRKLRCDGIRPSCGTCSRLGHDCRYDEVRKKSGPKRGYVKLLEARLKQVESLLETRDDNDVSPPTAPAVHAQEPVVFSDEPKRIVPHMNDVDMSILRDIPYTDPSLNPMPDFNISSSDEFSWEMIGLGIEEPLPTQDVIDELYELYFAKVHPSLPMIHRPRFLASMNLAPHARPAVCLRYAIWAHGASMSEKYSAYSEHFYSKARKYAEQDEMKGHGESIISLAHCQCWTLLACHEFKMMYFPRAWMSIGRATRLAQMMGLHRQDRLGLDVKQTLPPPRDWTDREERRRTFWMAFCQDRYASVGTGWPMTFDEADVLTNLPATEEAFVTGTPENTSTLADVLRGEAMDSLTPFSGVILMASMFGKNLTHLHRPHPQDNDFDLNGEFWKRHRTLDNTLLNTSLAMPAQLRLPNGILDPNAIFCNMQMHTSTICLHQAAIFKADKNRLPPQISAESKRRCIVAADQVTNIMKMISHIDLSIMNPFIAFCLYVSARVFLQYLKSRRDDQTIKSSLTFLLSAMQALKSKNPLTESFLVQLDVDLEGSGITIGNKPLFPMGKRPMGEIPVNTDGQKCSPLFEIREQHNPYPTVPRPSKDVMQERAHLATPSFDGPDANQTHNSSIGSRNSNGPSPIATGLTPSSSLLYEQPQGDPFAAMNNHNNTTHQMAHQMRSPTNSSSYQNSLSDMYGNSNGKGGGSGVPGSGGQTFLAPSIYETTGGSGLTPGTTTGMTPGATGMTPAADSFWSNLDLNNMDWNLEGFMGVREA